MTGLLLLLVAGLWLVVVVFVSRWVGSLAKAPWRRAVVGGLAFALLLPLPLLDEIVGGYQFRSLCRANASEFRIGGAKLAGRTARVTIDPSDELVQGTAIPIRHSRVRYHDALSGELLVEFDAYVAKSGRFIKAIGISENDSPLIIGMPWCSPERRKAENARLTFNFNVIN